MLGRHKAYEVEQLPKPKQVREEPIVEPFAVKFVSERPSLRALTVQISDRLCRYIPESGRVFSPYRFAAESVFITFASLPAIPVALILAILIHPAALALTALPLLLLFVPYFRIRGWIGDRRRSLDEELPFFAIHASILQTAGRDLYDALCSTIGRGVFRQVERDAAIMRRNTSYFRMGSLEGLEELGRTNPNPRFRSLLLGYSSEQRSGGDAARYLERRTDDLLKEHEYRWTRYLESVSFSGELTVMLFFLFPIFLLMGLFIAPGFGVTLAQSFLVLGLPAVIAVTFVIMRGMQPKSFDRLEGSVSLAALLAATAGAVSLSASFPAWGVVAAITGAGAVGYGLPVALQRRQIHAHESALPDFLRDVIEYQKLGYELTRAVSKIAEENHYNREFDSLLANVSRQLAAGSRLSEVRAQTRSWIAQMSFFFLGEVAECGAYQTRSLEMLTDFTSGVLRTRRRVGSAMRIYRWLALASPLVLGVLVGMMVGFLGSLSAFQAAGAAGAPLLAIQTVSPVILSLSQALVLFAGVAASWLASYAADFTPHNTCWIGAGVVAAAIGISFAGPAAGVVSGIM